MIPVAFEGLSATLHPASGRRGVIILGSAGFEDLCAHRFLTALGEETARHGLPALRFDLRGFGDSEPAALDAALIASWIDDIASAARWMKREIDCEDLVIVGLRLGALLASAALGHPSLAGCRLALLAPPAGGKAYLRELRIFARVVAAPPSAPDLDGLDVAGFHMPEDLLRGIAPLDWSGLARAGQQPLLVAGPVPAALASSAQAAAIDIVETSFEGYERLMCDPTASVVPGPVVRAVAAWMAEGALPGVRRPMRILEARVTGTQWQEEGVAFGPRGLLNGILCTPRSGHSDVLAVFTNPGGIRRTGWGNMWVDMARDLAASGIASLRFDFSNLDADLDSDAPAFHYGDAVWSEVTAVADFAETRSFETILAVGACSGAYHCLRAASFDTRISATVLVNQLCYIWTPVHAMPLAAWMKQKAGDFDRKRRSVDEDQSELARLRARLMVKGLQLAKTSAKSALRQLRTLATLLPATGKSEQAGVTPVIREILGRGCRIDVVQTEGDPSIAEYDREVGSAGDLTGLTRTIIPEADHLLTPRSARDTLLAQIRATAEGLRKAPEKIAARA